MNKAIWCVCAKLGKYDFCKDDEEAKRRDGKPAETKFKKLWYDEKTKTSLVECKPITGKTHQIRVHCKSIGCSIVNDVNYGGVFVGNLIEKEILKSKQHAKHVESPKELHKPERDLNDEPELVKKLKTETSTSQVENKVVGTNKIREEEKNEKTVDGQEEDGEGERSYIREIWLHSTQYEYKDQVFKAPLPYWTSKDYEFEWPNA